MNTLKRMLGIGGVFAIGLLLSQARCGDNNTSTPADLAKPADLLTPPDMAMNAAPTITSVSPASVVNTGGMITVTGTGFLPGAKVSVGGADCTGAVVTATSITCTAPAKATMCGKQNVVATNTDQQAASSSAGVFYRSATLTFATKADITVAAGPNMISLADFNKDTKLDIAVSHRNGGGGVSLLTGKGDGTFNTATSPATGLSNPIGLDAGDFNGDGNADFVTAVNGGNNGLAFNLYTGKGDGTFNAALVTSVTGLTGIHGVRFADVNGDGSTDVLAVANNAGATSLVARLNDKVANNNGFSGAQPVLQSAGANTTFITSGDFNKDGSLDVAMSAPGANYVSIRTGDKTGAFAGTTTLTGITNVGQVVSGDFNNDGNIDLAAAAQGTNNVYVYMGSANGNFMAATGSPFMVGTNPIGLFVADINVDGFADIVAMNNLTANVTVLIGNGQGGFTGGTANTLATATGGFGVVAGDLTGDGLPDIVTANSGTNSFTVGTTLSVLLQQCR